MLSKPGLFLSRLSEKPSSEYMKLQSGAGIVKGLKFSARIRTKLYWMLRVHMRHDAFFEVTL